MTVNIRGDHHFGGTYFQVLRKNNQAPKKIGLAEMPLMQKARKCRNMT